MKFSLVSLLVSSALLASAALPSYCLADDKPMTQEQMKELVKQVIKDNPKFIMNVLEEYEDKQRMASISKAAQNLVKKQDEIKKDPHSPSVGNPDADVTVTEFFDYHCGYCKHFYPEIGKLVQQDKNVRVVFKEFPILSDDSTLAARAALAVFNVDKSKYFDYHILLMQSSGEFTESMLEDTAKKVGIDSEQFEKAYKDPAREKDLQDNKDLAKSLSVTGTPAIIIGTEFMPGAVPYNTLKEKVQEVRDAQNQTKPESSSKN